jgi:uncharacterized protein YebE (UPF0316 family)
MAEIEKKEKWYFKTSVFIIALLCVGPFALPLLWFNPRYKMMTKVSISVIVIIITYCLTIWLVDSIKNIMTYYNQLLGLGT